MPPPPWPVFSNSIISAVNMRRWKDNIKTDGGEIHLAQDRDWHL